MCTKIHNLTIYPILENCKFWGVTEALKRGFTCDGES